MGEDMKVDSVVPESFLKKQKRAEEWALVKKQETEASKKKNAENRKIIFSRAKKYAAEYEEQQKELIRLKREAKLKGGFYVNPEAKLLFIIRIRGINAMDPKSKTILQLLRLRQLKWLFHTGEMVFSLIGSWEGCLITKIQRMGSEGLSQYGQQYVGQENAHTLLVFGVQSVSLYQPSPVPYTSNYQVLHSHHFQYIEQATTERNGACS